MDIAKIREDFPALRVESPPAYLDNACVTMRPDSVIEAILRYYRDEPSCAGRSVHRWGMSVTRAEMRARRKTARFVGAASEAQVVFTRNTTHSINQVAAGIDWQDGDVVLTTDREHNSNTIPWRQQAAKGVEVRIVRSTEEGGFDLEEYEAACAEAGDNLRMVALAHQRNLDGTSIPAAECGKIAHDYGAEMCLDAAQSVPHRPIDMKNLNCDYLAFSFHKMLGPSGLGALVFGEGKELGLESIMVGGQAIKKSTLDGYSLRDDARRYEGGLGHFAGFYGVDAAIDYLSGLDMQEVHEHEVKMNKIISDGVDNLEGFDIIGPRDAAARGGITSTLLRGRDPHETAMLLDEGFDVFVRSGFHCVDPWFHANGESEGSLRASLYIYTDTEECRRFVDGLTEICENIPRC